MHQAIKIVGAAAAFAVCCSLPYATHANLGDPRTLKMLSQADSFNGLHAAPVDFSAFSSTLNLDLQPVSFEMPADASLRLLGLSEFGTFIDNPDSAVATATPATLAPLSGTHEATPQRAEPKGARPTRAAFYSLPRALDTNVDRVSFDTPTLAPMAFIRFCMRYSQDCTVHRMAFRPRPVELTKARKAELIKVNRDVNRAIRPQANLGGVMAEEWLVAPREGDCNDYAVTKRHKLLALGWPSRSLLLAEVVVSSGEHHLVLVVRTREEDLVLDSLNGTVRPISQIGYQVVRAQQPQNPKFWSTISIERGTRVAMNAR